MTVCSINNTLQTVVNPRKDVTVKGNSVNSATKNSEVKRVDTAEFSSARSIQKVAEELPDNGGTKSSFSNAVETVKKGFSSFFSGIKNFCSKVKDTVTTAVSIAKDVVNCVTSVAKDVGRILRTFKIKKNVEVTDNGKIII